MPPPYRACLIDALGTMVRLSPPWERIDPAAVEGLDPDVVRRAFRAEMRHYAANADRGRDPARWRRCAPSAPRSSPPSSADPIDVATMMAAIHFDAYPDAAPALARPGASAACGSSASPTGTTSSARCSSGSGSPTCSTASSPPPAPAPASRTRRSSSAGLADRRLRGGRGDPRRRQRRGRRGARAAGIDVIRIDRDGAARGPADVSSLAEIVDRGDADGQNGRMTESERPNVGSTPPPGSPAEAGDSLPPADAIPGRSTPPPSPVRPPRRRVPASRRNRSRRPAASS